MADQLRDGRPCHGRDDVPVVVFVLGVVVPVAKPINFLGVLLLDGQAEGGSVAGAVGGRGGGGDQGKGKEEQQRKRERMWDKRAAALPPTPVHGHG